jgi:hypothetical protein
MPKTVIRWQRKQAAPAHSYTTLKNLLKKPEGIDEVTSWLETSKPEEVLEDLRNYQADWCSHVYRQIAVLQSGGQVISTLSCEKCGHLHNTRRAVASG